jgi:hypothetical protein
MMLLEHTHPKNKRYESSGLPFVDLREKKMNGVQLQLELFEACTFRGSMCCLLIKRFRPNPMHQVVLREHRDREGHGVGVMYENPVRRRDKLKS